MKWGRAPEKEVGKKFSFLLETGKGGAKKWMTILSTVKMQ